MTPKLPGRLFIVSTPIGNWDDITLRAINTLKAVDAVICEETKEGSKTLHKLGVQNALIPLNEHNEAEQTQEILLRMLNGESFALISDCGTPVFADPGQLLINTLRTMGITISPVPGASSLMAALSVVHFPIKQFFFAGFLPRKEDERKQALLALKQHKCPIILMDTPYRLTKLLEEVIATFGKNCNALLACDITLPTETLLSGTLQEILSQVKGKKLEFILVLDMNRQIKK